MANTLEFIIKATDQASAVVGDLEKKITGSSKTIGLSLTDIRSGFELAGMAAQTLGKVYDALVGSTVKYASEVKDLALTLSLSAEETSKILSVGQKFGVSNDMITASLQMMTKRGLAPSLDGLAALSDRIMAIQDPVQRAAELSDIFGRNWTALMPILEKGGSEIRSAADEAVRFGKVLSTDDVDAVEKMQIAANTLAEKFDGLSIKVGKTLIPILNDLVDTASRVVDNTDLITNMLFGSETEIQRDADRVKYLTNMFGENSDAVKAAINIQQQHIDKLKSETQASNDLVDSLKKQTDLTGPAATKAMISKATGQTFAQTKTAVDLNTRTDLSKLTPEAQAEAVKQYNTVQSNISDIEKNANADREKTVADAMDAIDKLESKSAQTRADIISQFASDSASRLSDMRDKQIDILTSYASDEQRITEQQNKSRLVLAQSFGVEVERMEQDHQRSMQRMAEDHGRRLSKLADDRNALGIEDEQANYQVDARRAEEDYQTTAARKNEDYARQLADLNASAEEQRRARAADRDKQLADLNTQFNKQDVQYKAAYQKQLDDLKKNTDDQRREIQTGEAKRIADIKSKQEEELANAQSLWKQWRNEHGIFLEGEKKAYDDFLAYSLKQLQNAVSGGIPTAPGSTSSLGHKAAGGGVDPYQSYLVGENGPEILRMGGRGGTIIPNGGMPNITFNIGPVNGGDPQALAAELAPMVHNEIARVFREARK